MGIRSSLSPIISNIYMEHFEKSALDSAQHIPSLWLRCVNVTSVIWSHGSEQLQNLLSHLNSLRPAIQFTMERESDIVSPFLDVLVMSKERTMANKVFRKPTHTSRYLNFVINSKGRIYPSKGEKRLGFVYILYVYIIRMIFRTKYTLRTSLMQPVWKEICNKQHNVYSIPRECGSS
jgi:hypothetical protein